MLVNKTDDMKTIQTKLNEKGSITFSPGNYKITKQLIVSSNTTIDLNGAVLQRKKSIQSIFLNKVNSNTTGYNGDGNIVIKNGTLEGFGGYSYDNLITFFHSHDITLINVTFKDILCHGIEFNSCKNVTVKDCKFLGYNLKNPDSAYKECIQLDYAGYAAFVLKDSNSKSKCYDGTCCSNITISDCLFTKSDYRDYPYVCIGEHAQQNNTRKHTNIKILNNEFHCKMNNQDVYPCLSFISMENVEVHENKFDCPKIARIYSKNYSYTTAGAKVDAKNGEGICKDISITNNILLTPLTKKKAFTKSNKSGTIEHTNIICKI